MAVEAPPVGSFPASPGRKLGCPATVEAEPWRCPQPEETNPVLADRAAAQASAAATDRAADSRVRDRELARMAPAQDRIPWRAEGFRPILAPAAQARAQMALQPCPECREKVAAAAS